MAQRWRLGRAGICNVYQYGDEVLHFAGGRLLLRGVNGSGKSTAMNMLLPFLLDADTRRIDAAGEQAGVLKSWMLAGRDDAQPVGYLWLELERGDDHLCFGCGIKANRASDTVTTWWWVTSRRPGIDLALVEDQRPRSAEGLRAELDPDPVFRADQRGAYRDELRSRLYGGADLDQHIRLLHIVRNPRVGDRVDLDLPDHLRDALPQLSEAALHDAAQPLDDLEEHRRNVTELTRTAATLDALVVTYADYARAELRRRSADAARLAAGANEAEHAADQAGGRADAAAAEASDAGADVDRLAGEEAQLQQRLAGLKERPAYAAGLELRTVQAHVADLALAVGEAEGRLAGRRGEEGAASTEHAAAVAAAGEDHADLVRALEELSAASVASGLPVAAPDRPAPPAGDDPGEWSATASRARLEQLAAAVTHRRGDVGEVRLELARVAGAEGRLERASDEHAAAEETAVAARQRHAECQDLLRQAGAVWLHEVHGWLAALGEHQRACELPAGAAPDLAGDAARRHREVVVALDRLAAAADGRHADALATLRARADREEVERRDAAQAVADLDAVTLPPPPALPWQRPDRGPVLAEVVDFADDVTPADRAGLEAALEASGLLAAEIGADASLAGADGTLLLRASTPVAAPLSRLLRPAADASELPSGTVDAVLAAIAVSDVPDAGAVVGVDGGFRVGPLSGRHDKAAAEHIGAPARRALLERRRAGARGRLAAAEAALAATAAATSAREARRGELAELRSRLPRGDAIAHAGALAAAAAGAADDATEALARRSAEVSAAEAAHAEAVDKARRVAANLGLAATAVGLAEVEVALDSADQCCGRARGALTLWDRSMAAWERQARRWRAAREATAEAEASCARAVAAHEREAAHLAGLEAVAGADPLGAVRQVEAAEAALVDLGGRLAQRRQQHLHATARAAAARSEADGARARAFDAARRCVAALPALRAALAVPGLAAAATGATDAEGSLRAPVEESPAGLLRLAAAIADAVPAPSRPDATAEGVRRSLRQRREGLGAGWDADDRQPDEALPLAVEVTGPDGNFPLVIAAATVAARRAELAALLSAEQDDALRNLLHGMVAEEVTSKLRAADELVGRMNQRLHGVTTAHGIGVSLRWRRRDGLDAEVAAMVDLLAKPHDLRHADEDDRLRAALAARLDDARRQEPDASYSDLVARVLDYKAWYDLAILLRRPGRNPERLARRTALSEGEKKIVSYLPLFAAVAASCDTLAERAPDAPRFVLLDDAFAKVSEDNHPKLFGLLVELDLDVVATSERLWGTYATVPELAVTEVIRDAALGVIVLEHSRWSADGGLAAAGG